MGLYRIFLAHPKDTPQDATDRMVAELTAVARRKLRGNPFEVVTGHDDWKARSVTAGGWNGWSASVATGVVPLTGEPLFHAIVIPWLTGGLIGKATAQIASAAKQAGKAVRCLKAGELYPVTNLAQVDPKSWKRGFQITIGPDPV